MAPTAGDGLVSPRVEPYQPIKELVAFVERAHADAFVQTVHAATVRVAEHAAYAVGGNAGVDGEAAVGSAGEQGRHNRHSRPHLRAYGFDRPGDLASERRRRRERRLVRRRDLDLVVRHDLRLGLLHFRLRFSGPDAVVHRGVRALVLRWSWGP